ncbi:nicotinate-nicotinamide nucleotide adenylyltransferase [Mariprofundus sp. EBB-1]|uniref:nicotinate-nicotinamide nucleotide adenylyltransferase n=1 Tax=Mariprofundus sp. EBB-1 TaxID=2650971 RepID=UPI001F408B8D|nr:nicotinate-nicotinamide nucleotide adenylyltransferase [Mariprofundus sp. EBB-1]
MSRVISAKQIGLFGGSFDPPHLGHMALVEAGLAMGLDEVWVIPALPVHRILSGCADGAVRLTWLQQMFEHDSRVRVLDWEVCQSESTPMVDTLRRFKALYPAIVPWLMLGSDAWRGLESWREYPAHQGLCNVAVFARKHTALNKAEGMTTAHPGWRGVALECWSDCTMAGHWCDVQVSLPDISATMIREQAYLGLSLTDLVPKVLQSEIKRRYLNKESAIESV